MRLVRSRRNRRRWHFCGPTDPTTIQSRTSPSFAFRLNTQHALRYSSAWHKPVSDSLSSALYSFSAKIVQ